MSTLVNALRVKIWIFDANSLRCCSPSEQFAVRFNQFARFATGDDAFLGPLCMREGCWFALLICVTTLSKSLLERESTYTRILTCKLACKPHESSSTSAGRRSSTWVYSRKRSMRSLSEEFESAWNTFKFSKPLTRISPVLVKAASSDASSEAAP